MTQVRFLLSPKASSSFYSQIFSFDYSCELKHTELQKQSAVLTGKGIVIFTCNSNVDHGKCRFSMETWLCEAFVGAGLRMAQLLQELRGMFIVFTVVDMRHQRILLMSNMENLSVVPDSASSMVAQKCAVCSYLHMRL